MSPRELPLTGKLARGRVAWVSEGKYDLAMQYRWRVWEVRRPNGRVDGPYAAACLPRVGGRPAHVLYLHTLLTGWVRVDHRNGNGLDCTDDNMREATAAQNGHNQGRRRGSSRFKGVTRTRNGRWLARIRPGDGRRLGLGTYLSEVRAALAYDAAARELHGEFARPNFPAFCTDCLTRRTNADSAV